MVFSPVESPRAGVFPCCPTAHTVDCCTNIKSCDKSLKTGRSLIQLYGFLQYKALCSNPINTTACLAGFYRDGSGKAQPCPPGAQLHAFFVRDRLLEFN